MCIHNQVSEVRKLSLAFAFRVEIVAFLFVFDAQIELLAGICVVISNLICEQRVEHACLVGRASRRTLIIGAFVNATGYVAIQLIKIYSVVGIMGLIEWWRLRATLLAAASFLFFAFLFRFILPILLVALFRSNSSQQIGVPEKYEKS